MSTSTRTPEPVPVPPQDAQWFALMLLQHPHKAVQTPLVVAVVAELLDILRDEQVSDQDAHRGLERAVHLLRVFAGEPRRSTQLPDPWAGQREYPPSAVKLAEAAASRRFAAAWLRGTPRAAIRTEPVIRVVDELLNDLQWQATSRDAQAALRHAVQLLGVFVTDQHTTQQRR